MLLTSKTRSAPRSDFSSAAFDAPEPIAMQSPVVDALLEVDAHGAECRQRPPPIVARVDVLGADDGRLAGDLVHGGLLGASGGQSQSRL